ncbi:MAG: 4Fe-4S dicluster domain-containing protein [Anaerolineae bacterium]
MTSRAKRSDQTSRIRQETLYAARGRLVFDPKSCRTCRVCEQACAITHEGYARPTVSRVNVTFNEFVPAESAIQAQYCRQCQDAPCIIACPNGAMTREGTTGAVIILEEKCTGCMRCRKACEWAVPKLHPERKVATKCDLCHNRAEGPACVQFCPLTGKALSYDHSYYTREVAHESL